MQQFVSQRPWSADLLLAALAQTTANVPPAYNAHLGKGNVLLFANNPVYRGETGGKIADNAALDGYFFRSAYSQS